jgi:tetratricopeptide (TPR) repeat protein
MEGGPMKYILLAVSLAWMLIFAGCGTIMEQSGPQTIHISSIPEGADVVITRASTNELIQKIKTPADVTLERIMAAISKEFYYDKCSLTAGIAYRLQATMPGYIEESSKICSTNNDASFWGNFFSFGLTGAITDSATGAAFDLIPKYITIKLYPDTKEGLKEKANNIYSRAIACDNDDYDEIIRLTSQAISIDASFGKAYLLRSKSLVAKGKPNEAITDVEEALKMDGDSPEAYMLVGCSLRMKGDINYAI